MFIKIYSHFFSADFDINLHKFTENALVTFFTYSLVYEELLPLFSINVFILLTNSVLKSSRANIVLITVLFY